MARILGISGSLRAKSYNTALLNAAVALQPAGTQIETASIRGIPLYDGDVEEREGIPASVSTLKKRIEQSDALLLVMSRGEKSRGWIPSKFFQYLGTGNPVLALAPEGEVRDILARLGVKSLDDIIGRATPNVTDWQYLNLNYVAKAHIDQDACIKCGRCHIACEDTSHQAITSMVDGVRHFEVIEAECVGCNLCVNVCPVENCITMEPLAVGVMDQRTGKPVSPIYANWTTHPNNPMAKVAAE